MLDEKQEVDTTEIDSKIRAAKDDLRRLERERYDMLREPWGIDAGDRVKCRRTGKLGTIASISMLCLPGRPWVNAFMDRKDGTPSAVAKCLYEYWDRVEP